MIVVTNECETILMRNRGKQNTRMNTESIQNKPWQTESVRLTFFCDDGQQKEVWKTLTGSEPENITQLRQENTKIETGAWDDNLLNVTSHLDRVSITIHSRDNTSPALPNIGSLELALGYIPKVMESISLEKVTRVGLGLVVLYPGDSKKASYDKLAEILPEVKISNEMSDFMYQYNLPTYSERYDGLIINNLIKFAVAKLMFMRFTAEKQQDVVEKIATRVEVDVNTHADFILDETYDINQIIAELVEKSLDLIPYAR